MKKIKIWFDGFPNDFDINDNFFTQLLSEYYNVIVTPDSDYVFICTTYKHEFYYYTKGIIDDYCNFHQVRILVEGENLIPDFNLVDYAISPYPIKFFDRNFYLPCGVESSYVNNLNHFLSLPTGKRNFDIEDLSKKTYFANLLSRHDSEHNMRTIFFDKLSEYKRVEAPGRLRKNFNDKVNWTNESKSEFLSKCKFTICFESTKHSGFITEKIIDAFYSNTIPIYYGSENIADIFNPSAFINCNNYKSFDDVIDEIISIDNDNQKYISMMQEPIFNIDNYPQEVLSNLKHFLRNIFDQETEKSYRRSMVYSAKYHEDFVKNSIKFMLPITSIQRRINNLLCKLKLKKCD